MTVLANNTILSNFAATGRVTLLAQLYGEVYLAHAVYEEIQQGLADGYDFLTALEPCIYPHHADGWLKLVTLMGETELHNYQFALTLLDRGEAVSLAIAQYRGWRFLTDDRAARQYAQQNGIKIGGTLGVLALLVKRQFVTVDEANHLLATMIKLARYRTPYTDIRVLLDT